MKDTLYVITIYNVKTDVGEVYTTLYPEQIEEYRVSLEENQVMFINETEVSL